jgi:Ca2+-binding EF-hand superfamily protein
LRKEGGYGIINELRDAFQTFDSDNDGYISADVTYMLSLKTRLQLCTQWLKKDINSSSN